VKFQVSNKGKKSQIGHSLALGGRGMRDGTHEVGSDLWKSRAHRGLVGQKRSFRIAVLSCEESDVGGANSRFLTGLSAQFGMTNELCSN